MLRNRKSLNQFYNKRKNEMRRLINKNKKKIIAINICGENDGEHCEQQ